MNTVHLTDAELDLTRHALHAYLQSFSHDEKETLQLIRATLAKFESVETSAEASTA